MYTDPTGHRREGDVFYYDTDNYNIDVAIFQKRLNELGYIGADGKPLKVDGYFGDNTQYAVNQYQTYMNSQDSNFSIDGNVGDQTWYSMGLEDVDWNEDGWKEFGMDKVYGMVLSTYNVAREFGSIHNTVQMLASAQYGLETEVEIKGAGAKGTGTTNGYADLVDLKTDEVWEIKCDNKKWNEAKGVGRAQLERYITWSYKNGYTVINDVNQYVKNKTHYNRSLVAGDPRIKVAPFKSTVFGRPVTVKVRSGNPALAAGNYLENGMIYYRVSYDDKKEKQPKIPLTGKKSNNKTNNNTNKSEKSNVIEFPTPNKKEEGIAAVQPTPNTNVVAYPNKAAPYSEQYLNHNHEPNREEGTKICMATLGICFAPVALPFLAPEVVAFGGSEFLLYKLTEAVAR